MSISTHVLDATTGLPASGMPVSLWRRLADGWAWVSEARTDADGRVDGLSSEPGEHRLVFASGPWWGDRGLDAFHPEVVVTFTVADADAHHHVPLLAGPFSYTTYRGS
ncbi:MAG: hydroxyisourate hydrolase [Streptosporangiales bacterium]|nr:hydroxyisourate hydrolase [Streptosporangiales bacterium]MBO0891199.1 hydroxyisourate hydrolase [Acidothermales bacterium]